MLLVGAWLGMLAGNAAAGGGPENVLLVVNANSESSKTIAKHYIQLRQIPLSNVLLIDWKGNASKCKGDQFRKGILQPVLDAIRDRHLQYQIDYVVYSSGFPWLVDMRKDYEGTTRHPQFRPIASITGATYLWQSVLPKSGAALSPDANWYYSDNIKLNWQQCTSVGTGPTRGFRSAYVWTADGKATIEPEKGQSYLLSTVLGVTSGRGNTVDEVIGYLTRAARADGTRPPGTIYFMRNKDVRSQTRHDCFEATAALIRQQGVQSVVLDGIIPHGKRDIMGLTVGYANFDIGDAGDTILPGAICEHLTSYGGVLTKDAHHTPLTDFLRYGAAGASGTVAEPFSIQAKFPSPAVHLHYVRGCSLAESFYQSISSPYQLLIVGDPLCQPWGVFPEVHIEGITAGEVVSGKVTIGALAKAPGNRQIRLLEFFIDGRLFARRSPEETVTISSSDFANGPHELRVVAVESSAIETRGRAILPFIVRNESAPDPSDSNTEAEPTADTDK
jgi:uncharacterized protein (TIGR03790 family)